VLETLGARFAATRDAVDGLTDSLKLDRGFCYAHDGCREARPLVFLSGALLAVGLPRRRPPAKHPPVDADTIDRVVEDHRAVPRRQRHGGAA
jgi:hypothetical protein